MAGKTPLYIPKVLWYNGSLWVGLPAYCLSVDVSLYTVY